MSNETSPRLSLPYILQAQAQKHVTHNEAIRSIDALLHLTVESDSLTIPPGSPDEGACYIVAAGSSGAWTGKDGMVAAFIDGSFHFHTPREGWRAWNAETGAALVYVSGEWTPESAGSSEGAGFFGINTSADASNRLSVRADNVLFSAENGSHRVTVNRDATTDTASVLFKTNYSADTEFGMAGDDRFRIKVSPDGQSFVTAMEVDPSTGQAVLSEGLPAHSLLLNTDFSHNARGFSGGALAAGAYGFERWRAGSDGASITRSGNVNTLQSGRIEQVIETELFGGLQSSWVTLIVEELNGTVVVEVEGQTASLGSATRASASFDLGANPPSSLTIALEGQGASFQRVYLVRGRIARSYFPRNLDDEKALLARYFQRFKPAALGIFNNLVHFSSNDLRGHLTLHHAMRTEPTVVFAEPAQFQLVPGLGSIALSAISADPLGVTLRCTTSQPSTVGASHILRSAGQGTAAILLEAEFAF